MSAEDRKLAIVKAVLPLFARKGFAETTTKDLARAARISEPLLYKHFPSKEALYLEIQNYSCQGIEGVIEKLTGLKPSTSTLVHLVYHLVRAIVLGLPSGNVPWETRHRLMLKSFLDDGTYARLIYQERFAPYGLQIEASLIAAVRAGDVHQEVVTISNCALFAHHIGAWLAISHLPAKPVIQYGNSREELFQQAVWFILRGMGMTDPALKKYYDPKKLALFFAES